MLSAYEQETIINFNKDEDIAYIFTYEKTWQKHIEQRFGIKPYESNSFGAKSYKVPKSCIRKPMPHFKRQQKMTPERLQKLKEGRERHKNTTT